MPWLSFAFDLTGGGGRGVCFVHDAEGFDFMVGAFVLMHNCHFFFLGFNYNMRSCCNMRSCSFI